MPMTQGQIVARRGMRVAIRRLEATFQILEGAHTATEGKDPDRSIALALKSVCKAIDDLKSGM